MCVWIMDSITVLIIVGAVIAILFLFVVLFIYILKLQRKAKLQTKIALMQSVEGTHRTEFGKDYQEKKPKVKKVKSWQKH